MIKFLGAFFNKQEQLFKKMMEYDDVESTRGWNDVII